MIKGRRGQFYIIGAVIIIMIIAGFVTASNRSTSKPASTRFYDLSKDYESETSKVIDFGVYSKYSPEEDIAAKTKDISEKFAKYALEKDPNIRLAYVYGDDKKISTGTMKVTSGDIKLCTSSSGGCSQLSVTNSEGITEQSSQRTSINTVKVNVTGSEYSFDLKPGQNFYFVIQTESAGERTVVQKSI